ncbi:tyrosine-type recombinase/integrase [Sharpea azabuensis]|uniref:tyrosine-type recombinase/integrase n=1 Tax=Sharpea azabuensis TaxID=322505 RepID=UPI002E820933|nr:tyrosine-type recombinase/integrase [Sharpea azabuensis]MEE3308892.1 tyrosine-type recombinase/integrase [Sharpea azabuensis]
MDGNEVFDNKYIGKLNAVYDTNQDKPYLVGFADFISEKSYSTVYAYVGRVARFMNDVNKKPSELTLDDYTAFLAKEKNKTASYQIVVYTALREFSRYLSATKVNTLNPMQYKKRPKFKESNKTKQKRENGYLEGDQLAEYISNVENGICGMKTADKAWTLRDYFVVMLFLNTGMRCAALWKLNVDNIDIENKVLKTIDKGEKVQIYPLSDKMIEITKRWLADRELKLNGKHEDALVISKYLTRISQGCIADIVTKYAIDIKGKHITPHKLRATAITAVYEGSGKNIYVAQQFAGHSNPKVTELYVRGQKDKARELGADIMSKITKV